METDLTPHLLIPTCAQCDEIGLREMPELLCDIEAAFGFDVLKAFLFAYGGGEYYVKVLPTVATKQSDLWPLHLWLKQRLYGGKITIPMGNIALITRVAWTIAMRLREGWSLATIARAVGCDTRTVSMHKKRLIKIGWLRAALPNPESKAL